MVRLIQDIKENYYELDLKFQSHYGSINTFNNHFQCSSELIHFNPTMVRLIPNLKTKRGLNNLIFQSHYGSINT